MTSTTCLSMNALREYARCSGSQETAILIEQHLTACNICRLNFANIVDAGVFPNFMQWYIKRGDPMHEPQQMHIAKPECAAADEKPSW